MKHPNILKCWPYKLQNLKTCKNILKKRSMLWTFISQMQWIQDYSRWYIPMMGLRASHTVYHFTAISIEVKRLHYFHDEFSTNLTIKSHRDSIMIFFSDIICSCCLVSTICLFLSCFRAYVCLCPLTLTCKKEWRIALWVTRGQSLLTLIWRVPSI